MKNVILIFSFIFFAGKSLASASIEDSYEASSGLDYHNYVSYNRLTTPEVADASLKAKGSFSSFLEQAANLAAECTLPWGIGMRLLHKHFSLSSGQVIAEQPKEDMDHGLKATPVDRTSLGSDLVPASWIWNQETKRYEVFEFSTDETARSLFSELKTNDSFFEFLRRFNVLASDHGLLELLAPAIVARKSWATLDWSTHIILEKSYSTPIQISVLSPISREEVSDASSIETSWNLSTKKDQDGCRCSSLCFKEIDPSGFGYTHNSQHPHYYS